jgi:hypothetical protein
VSDFFDGPTEFRIIQEFADPGFAPLLLSLADCTSFVDLEAFRALCVTNRVVRLISRANLLLERAKADVKAPRPALRDARSPSRYFDNLPPDQLSRDVAFISELMAQVCAACERFALFAGLRPSSRCSAMLKQFRRVVSRSLN